MAIIFPKTDITQIGRLPRFGPFDIAAGVTSVYIGVTRRGRGWDGALREGVRTLDFYVDYSFDGGSIYYKLIGIGVEGGVKISDIGIATWDSSIDFRLPNERLRRKLRIVVDLHEPMAIEFQMKLSSR